ncbi:MAG: hypothetical protein ABL871_19210 [Terricaulis sp.]
MQTVFDLGASGYEPPAFPLMLGCFIAAITLVQTMRPRSAQSRLTAFGAGLVLFLMVGLMVVSHHSEFERLKGALTAGHAEVVQGRVVDFRPDSNIGNGQETFSVSGVQFIMRSAEITSSFNSTVGAGGPDLSDQCVRVAFVRESDRAKIVQLFLLPACDRR